MLKVFVLLFAIWAPDGSYEVVNGGLHASKADCETIVLQIMSLPLYTEEYSKGVRFEFKCVEFDQQQAV